MTTLRIFLSCLSLCALSISVRAADEFLWKDAAGKPVALSPARKSAQGFGGMLLITGDADWKEKWMKPSSTPPRIGEIDSIKRGESLNVLIFFSNPMVDKKTLKADIRCNLEVIRPDGKSDIKQENQNCFLGDPGPNLNHVFLANQAIGFVAEPKDPKGVWKVRVALEDKNRKVRLDLETEFELK